MPLKLFNLVLSLNKTHCSLDSTKASREAQGLGGGGEDQDITEAFGSDSRCGSQRGSMEAVPSFEQLSST